MFKFIGTVIVLGLTFYGGYYAGKRSFGEMTQTIGGFSRDLMDKTLGFERTLRLRQSLLDAKGHVIQAKGHVIDRDFGTGAKDLAKAGEALENSLGIERSTETAAKLKPLLSAIRVLQHDMESGKPGDRGQLRKIEKQLDGVLGP